MLWGDVELTLPCASPAKRERSSFSIAWASSSSETDSSGGGELLDGEGRRSPREALRRQLDRTTLHADDAGYVPVRRRPKSTPSTASTSSGASQSVLSTDESETSTTTKQKPFPESMRTPVIDAAEHSTEVVRREALKAAHSHPSKLKNVRLLETKSGVSIYHYRKRRPKNVDYQKEEPSLRVLGVTQLHASLNEIVNLIGPKSALSFAMLNPGVADYKMLCVLIDEPTHYVTVKSMAMDSQWQAPHTSRPRIFTVIESQQAFQTDDGRRGWAVSFHSLFWSSCPQPPLGAVRGSVYNTGLVALETTKNSHLVDLFTVAEFNLKGQASARTNFLAARDRVFDTLLLVNGTLEQRAANELSLLRTTDFNEIQRLTKPAETCSQCSQRGESPMHRCRKCCVAVCSGCSTMWRRGKKEMRLCFDCWAETTLQF